MLRPNEIVSKINRLHDVNKESYAEQKILHQLGIPRLSLI